MTPPLVTVIMPTFNHAHYLSRSIGSVLAQTLPDWELIVVDNSSTDETIHVIDAFQDSRIRRIKIENEGVIARSRNLGIACSQGKFVAFLDSDDYWYPEKLSTCIRFLQSHADVVCHGELWVGGSQPVREVFYGPEKHATARRLLLKGNCLSTSATVAKADLLHRLGGFSEDPRFVTAEDYELWIRIAGAGANISFVSEILGEFTRSLESASSDIPRNTSAVIAVCETHFPSVIGGRLQTLRIRQRRARAWYGAGRAFTARHQTRNAWSAFGTTIRLSPFILRLYPAILILALISWRRKT